MIALNGLNNGFCCGTGNPIVLLVTTEVCVFYPTIFNIKLSFV